MKCSTCGALANEDGSCYICAVDQHLADDPGDPEPSRVLGLTSASSIKLRVPKWLWHQRIPLRGITLLGGREGIGKSTTAAHIAAAVTRGTLPGRNQLRPAGVIIAATEDTWSEVIVPRLIAAGADLELVYRVDVDDPTGPAELSLPADLDRLERLCVDHKVALVICDPLLATITGKIDTHKDAEVRQALTPLQRFADRAGVAIIGLIHVNKSGTTDPLQALMGSKAFAAVARSVLFCAEDPEAPDRYLLGHPKSNLGPKQPTLTYTIEPHRIQLDEPDEDGDDMVFTSRIVLGAEDERSMRDVMEQAAVGRRSDQGELAEQILTWLREQGRAVPTKEIEAQFPDEKAATVRKNLSRLVTRGRLTKPVYGHYSAECGSSVPVPPSMSHPSHMSQDNVTVTGVAGFPVPEGVPHSPVTPDQMSPSVVDEQGHLATFDPTCSICRDRLRTQTDHDSGLCIRCREAARRQEAA